MCGRILGSLVYYDLWDSLYVQLSNTKEIANIMRQSFQVIRVYIYEALAIIVASVFLGASIGIAVSITLTVQLGLFTELPFWFQFPYPLRYSSSLPILIYSEHYYFSECSLCLWELQYRDHTSPQLSSRESPSPPSSRDSRVYISMPLFLYIIN